MNKNDSVKLGDIYGGILRKVKTKPFNESADQNLPREGKGKKKTMPLAKHGGPSDVEDIEEPAVDAKKISKKENINSNNLGGDTEKINKEAINNVMAKSIFDKLYTEMMGGSMGGSMGPSVESEDELSELGIDSGEEGDDLEMGDEGDEVTISMPRDVAKQLCDLLKSVVGDESTEDDMGEDDMGGDMGDEEDFSFDEDEEGEVKGHAGSGKVPFTGKGENKVGGALSKVAGGTADGKYTVGDGKPTEHGHPMHGAKVPGELTGKSNKVNNNKKPGDNLFN